ncbi:MAG: hypothetical protein NWE89_14200 [Candidatus Bathyarchaeota archaeon]|nr:hypothetical protein [Candidatus Bathyarchaeota archaeon]
MRIAEMKIWKAITDAGDPLSHEELSVLTGYGSQRLSDHLMDLLKTGIIIKDKQTGDYRLPYAMYSREMYSGRHDLIEQLNWKLASEMKLVEGDLKNEFREFNRIAEAGTSAGYVYGEHVKAKHLGIDRELVFREVWESTSVQIQSYIKFLIDTLLRIEYDEESNNEKLRRNILILFKHSIDEYVFPMIQSLTYFVVQNHEFADEKTRRWWKRHASKILALASA